MTGLDKIIKQIQIDADNTTEGIKAKSEAQCNSLLSDAKAQAEAIREKGNADAEKKYSDIIARAESAASLEERKILLFTKQEIIRDMIVNTTNNLVNLPEDKYFDLIYKLISKYSNNADGVIFFNQTDLSRLPADFLQNANAASKGKLSLGGDAVQIDGGFILTYGGVDVNCSISSLISDNSEKISDAVAKYLFA